jgi:hypothetical protein
MDRENKEKAHKYEENRIIGSSLISMRREPKITGI